jgi:hypothetical protein
MVGIIEFIQDPANLFTWQVVSLLIVAGFLVGFINTIAGSGTVITYSLFMFMGMPANIANGTIRLGVILQTLSATINFKRNGVLDWKKGLILSIPIALGSIIGAQIAAMLEVKLFEKVLALIMLSMIFFLFQNPKKWVEGHAEKMAQQSTKRELLIFFGIGLYGGFTHIGVGIFLLAALVLKAGYDLVKANAIKVLSVLVYSPFALMVFIINNQVDYRIGLISAIGNIFGGILASRLAVNWGAGFIRWFLILIIVLFNAKVFGLFNM